jgi:hypothetical protein
MGEEGRDYYLVGGRGSDHIAGGEDTDVLLDGPLREASKDTFSGGDGDDFFAIDNEPAVKDTVSCGDGFDRVLLDSKDVAADDCERVFTSFEEFRESIPPEVWDFFDTFIEDQLAPSPIKWGLP